MELYFLFLFAKTLGSNYLISELLFEEKSHVIWSWILLTLTYAILYLITWKISPKYFKNGRFEEDYVMDSILFALPLVALGFIIEFTTINLIILIAGGLISIFVPGIIIGILL